MEALLTGMPKKTWQARLPPHLRQINVNLTIPQNSVFWPIGIISHFHCRLNQLPKRQKSHAQICVDAGPTKCQLLASNTNVQSDDYVNAHLSLRAEPEWLKTFKEDILTSVETAKGEMTGSGVQAEDLTRSILDTDAALKSKKVLRSRLENLLETRNAKLPDLMALERELAPRSK